MIVLDDERRREFTQLAFSPDGKLLAAAGGEKDPVIWDPITASVVHRFLFIPQQKTRWLAFDRGGESLYIASQGGLMVYPLNGKSRFKLLGYTDSTMSAALDPVGQRIVWYHIKTAMLIRDNRRLLTCTDVSGSEPRLVWQRLPVEPPNEGWAHCLAFLPDGTRFAAVEAAFPTMQHDGPRITIRATETGDALQRITGPGTECDQLAVSPRGDTLVTRLKTSLYVLDLSDDALAPRVLKHDNRKHFTGIAFHPSGRYLAATSNDATVKLYDTTTWQVAKTFTWEIGRMRSVAFSPDGMLAAAGSDTGKVVVWDVDI